MNFKDIKNIRWADARFTSIYCDVNFDDGTDLYQLVFVVDPSSDSLVLTENNNAIFEACKSGVYGSIADFVPPPPIIGEPALRFFTQMVSQKLEEADVFLTDPSNYSSLTLTEKDQWATYKFNLNKLLLDIKEPVFEFSMEEKWFVPGNFSFPTKP